MAESRLVRDATVEDAAACAAIYTPYVRDTVVSFELEPPTPAQMAGRIEAALARHAWLVLEDDDGRVVLRQLRERRHQLLHSLVGKCDRDFLVVAAHLTGYDHSAPK